MPRLFPALLLLFLTGACASNAPSPEATVAVPQASPAAASPSEEPPTEDKLSNTIRWTTASEVDNFGFDVYRSESEDGPFDVLTEQPLEGGGTVDEPQKYVFVDDTIDPTKDYFYFVESITMGGVRERFTPVVRAKAKRPPQP